MSQKKGAKHEDHQAELRRGPWTLEEDSLLIHYIARHGEGRWNLLARCSGLKRTGKSCRLRWLNYLKPDVKRGNLSPEEQFLILELHSKWGNRWSRIAQYLPGRTDNEIKNYWRTRVQKQARQLKIDANSSMFRDAVRCYWMPRLLEKMAASSGDDAIQNSNSSASTSTAAVQGVGVGSQAQHFNPFPQDQYVENCSVEYGQQGAPCTYAPSLVYDQYVHNVCGGLEGLDLAAGSIAQNVDYSTSSSECNLEGGGGVGGGNWMEGLWSMEELWQGMRRPQEWNASL